MPLKYALEDLLPNKHASPTNMTRWNSERVYTQVSKEIALTSLNGYVCLTNNHGEEVSGWIKARDDSYYEVKSTGKPHQDAMKEELAVGDFVAYSSTETTDLRIGQVTGFTKQKVHIRTYAEYDPSLKNPKSLVKISATILSE